MAWRFYLWVLTMLLLGQIGVWAQQPLYWPFDEDNFLPSNEVSDVYQSSTQMLWSACGGRLWAYDGVGFRSYESRYYVVQNLGGIAEDKWGRIWAHDFNGRLFYVEDDRLELFESWQRDSIALPIEFDFDEQGRLWVLHNERIFRYVLDRSCQVVDEASWSINNTRQFLLQDSFLYVVQPHTGRNRLYCLSQDNLQGREMLQSERIYLHGKVWFLAGDAPGTFELMSGYEQQVWQGEPHSAGLRVKAELRKTVYPNKVLRVGEEYWIGSHEGLFRYEYRQGAYVLVAHEFPQVQIKDMLIDHEGNCWLASLNRGLLMVPNFQIRYYGAPQATWGLGTVQTLAKAHGSLYIGGEPGYLFRYRDSVLERLPIPEQQPLSFMRRAESRGAEQLLYAGQRAYRFDGQKHEPLFFNSGIKAWHLLRPGFHLVLDDRGLHIFGEPGCDCLDLDYPFLRHFELELASQVERPGTCQLTLSRKRIFNVLPSKDTQLLLLSSREGLHVYDERGISPVLYEGQAIYASCLELDYPSGGYWVGSFNQGLYWLSEDTRSVSNFSRDRGVSSNHILDVVVEDDRYIWVITALGLHRILTSKWEYDSYSRENGILTHRSQKLSLFEGRAWVGSKKGLQSLPLGLVGRNAAKAKLTVLELVKQSDTLSADLKELHLREGETLLRVNLGMICFRSKGNFRLKYRLLGSPNSSWRKGPAGQGRIDLNNLSAGYYRLEVWGENEDGVESENNYILDLYVYPPYTSSWWFYFGLLSLAMTVAWLLFTWSFRGKRLELEKAKLEREAKASMLMAIRSQMNPHFIFNALNTIQNFIYRNDREQANLFLGKFSTLMRRVLSMSSSERVLLRDEIKALKLYLELEQMRFGDKLHYALELDEAVDEDDIYLPPMLIQPFVENALKHGLLHKRDNCRLILRFRLVHDDLMEVQVEDNGIGRVKAAELQKGEEQNKVHVPYASEANALRLKLLNANNGEEQPIQIHDFYDEQGKGCGTLVVLLIPIFLAEV